MADSELDDVCRPIDSLSEINDFIQHPPSWGTNTIKLTQRSKVIKNNDLYNSGSFCHFDRLAQTPARFEYGSVPKTLICHDMANGYHDDRYIRGTENSAAYCFYHWAAIDMFIYFSHHFITIPPLGWINAAHKNGVQILGTIITEWNDGIKICKEFLETQEKMEKFADQLVTIAKYLKMDGWLINIENKIEKVDMLLKFVKYLTKTIHEEIPGSVVIWYDSVTNDGSLSWQNCLNSKNIDFFNVCDGLFTNYCWGRSHLDVCVREAGSRKHDIYVGVDVWGRNFWGGGFFNTVEAVKEVHKVGLSLAIFAPAWTHEGIKPFQVLDQQFNQSDPDHPQSCTSKALDETDESRKSGSRGQHFRKCALREHFILRENAFWNTLWPYLNTRGPTQLPFQTFFCLGSGEKKRSNGEVIENKTWFDLQQQDYQLSSPVCANSHWLELELPEKPKPQTVTQSNYPVTNPLNTGPKRKRSCDLTESKEESDSKIRHGDEVMIKDDVILDHIEPFDGLPVNTTRCIVCPPVNDDSKESNAQEETIIKSESTNVEAKPYQPPIKKFTVKLNIDRNNCIEFYQEDSLEGGGCIKVSPVNTNAGASEISRLFVCEFLCDHNFTVYYAVKKLDPVQTQDLHLVFSLRNNINGIIFNIVLAGDHYIPIPSDKLDTKVILKPVNINLKSFQMLQENLLRNHSGFYIPVENDSEWDVRYFSLEYPNCSILEISCKLQNKTGRMLLGGLGIVKDVVDF